ncbi:MAG: chitobiase/beta-hexosaminidase C-terminal domain-containing protein [Firmicutes bacterium]|nr:chitobiase/beta-hexosaminidase C-terminal domain-containing protein [Bacillota bacterium]
MNGKRREIRFQPAFLLILLLCVSLLAGCGKTEGSGDPEYEAREIEIVSAELNDNGEPVLSKSITIEELRKLEQHPLDASYKRTTGLYEEFKMEGPYITDIFKSLDLDVLEYEAIGVQGTDGYYCLIPKDIIEKTPDMMLALVVDGEAKLSEDEAPARLAVQGQYGPYWVKKVNKITLYTEIPKKEITSVWVFDNLAAGIEPYEYEYYGSKDKAVSLPMILSRFDYVDSKAFFTMKSSDGFEKNEAMSMIKDDYYIKVEGEDAPTNASPNIVLGMNVKNISWFSTNADAAVFPKELESYMDKKTVAGKTGVPISEILFEAGVEKVADVNFDLLGTNGEKVTVLGKALKDAVLCINGDGTYSAVFDSSLGVKNIKNLMRIRVSDNQEAAEENEEGGDKDEADKNGAGGNKTSGKSSSKKAILTVKGNGVSKTTSWSIEELKSMGGYREQAYSVVNNWPTKKFFAGKGVDINTFLREAGVKSSAAVFKIISKDGYYITLTKDQLTNSHYYYPNIKSGSGAGAKAVPALLAWAVNEEGSSLSGAKEDGSLRLLIGQRGIHDVNTEACVKDISVIEVSTSSPGRWEAPSASPASGSVPAGSRLALSHGSMDRVKIYYTTDGSTPTYSSRVYNPSTTYFQPDLIKPIDIHGNMTVKILVSGWGKKDSAVETLTYTVE